jgi:hypothetical protein
LVARRFVVRRELVPVSSVETTVSLINLDGLEGASDA